MKPVTLFILHNCPYCKRALSLMEELKKEHPRYAEVPVMIIDEGMEPEIANQYDYYYVPTYYIEGVKVHEGVASKEIIQQVYEKAME
ncbi:thioredoxin family protein [Clostridium thermarum]|uniref:thioredoxin family protein n=1 Tax=Clostridium thermarum TaxID=1716543 RepID=UPI0013D35F01|nr:thioredoxin family protein [Clostridium thermarum]